MKKPLTPLQKKPQAVQTAVASLKQSIAPVKPVTVPKKGKPK